MQESKLVSVIIPVFNVRPYLAESLESVLCQTHENLQIIIVDDGSDDGSGAICDKYANRDNRVLVIHQQNRGLSTARNVGLDHVNGDVIAFLDPDDNYHPTMIATMLEGLLSNSADIAICDFSTHATVGRMPTGSRAEPDVRWRVIDRNKAFLTILERRMETAVWNKIYISDVWKGLRFPDGHVCEGTYIVFDIFDRASRIVCTDEQLVLHRNRPGSICNTRSLQKALDANYSTKHFLEFVETHTPGDFTYGQLARQRRRYTRDRVGAYLGFVSNGTDDKEGVCKLQAALRVIAENPRRYSLGVLTTTAVRFAIAHPRLCLLLYRPFRRIRQLLGK